MQPDKAAIAIAADDLARLAQASQSLGLGLSSSTLHKLLAYRDLLLRWNRVYNLTAVREPGEMLTQHLLDSLTIVPALTRALHATQATHPTEGEGGVASSRPRILDAGSGGGLPGVVLAVVMPDWGVTCVDAVAKKTAFVRQVGAELGLKRLQVHHARVEDLAAVEGQFASYDLITSRAFASLGDFTRLTRPLLKPSGVWAAMKGQVPGEELAQLGDEAQLFHVEQLTVPGLDAQRCLVWMKPINPGLTNS